MNNPSFNCNWNAIIYDIKQASNVDQSIINKMQQCSNISILLNPHIIAYMYNFLLKPHIQITVHLTNMYRPKRICDKSMQIYHYILSKCHSKDQLLSIQNYISMSYYKNIKISGRTIDFVMTKYAKLTQAKYFLHRTTGDINFDLINTNKNYMLIDIYIEYKQKLKHLSKFYFDCFDRSDTIEHRIDKDTSILISLSQFPFYIWLLKFNMLEYIYIKYDNIMKFKSKYVVSKRQKSIMLP